MKLMVDKTKADSLFVYYYVSSPQSREKIVRDASITGVPKTNVAYLRAFPIRLPSLPEQRAIAHILGSLDDKIDLCRRMNETLEAMARAIFKSWFVDFDPVRAKMEGRWRRGESLAGLAAHLYDLFPDRLVDSERGELPKGWSVGTIGDLCSRVIEKVEKPSEWKDALLIDLSRMPHKSLTLADWGLGEGLTTSVTRFRARDTLFGAIRPYFHKVGLAPMDGVTNVSVFVLRARNGEDWAYVLLFASSADTVEYATRVAKGTKMPVVSWQDLMKHRVPIPPEHLRAAFGRVVGPVLTRVIANTHECRTLAALRDTLLPKLISGELRVKDVERFSAKLV
jgi:type I restriction enzyme S subunit